MIWVDWCILALIAASALVGALRGFVREAFGLATWALAFFLAWRFSTPVAAALERYIATPPLREAVSYCGLFLVGLLIGGVGTSSLVDAIRNSRFSSADRTLGAGLGLIRGLLIVTIFVLFARMTAVVHDPWWTQSMLIARFEPLADGLGLLLPRRWMDRLGTTADASASVQL